MFSLLRTTALSTYRPLVRSYCLAQPAAVHVSNDMYKESIRARIIDEFATMGIQVTVTEDFASHPHEHASEELAAALEQVDLSKI